MSFGNTANEEKKSGKAPVDKIKVGGISVDVWENDGEKAKFYSFTLQRSYTKDAGKTWENTNSLREADLPKAILALQKAYEKSVIKEKD